MNASSPNIQAVYYSLIGVFALILSLGIYFEAYWLWVLPFLAVGAAWFALNEKWIYLLIWFGIPTALDVPIISGMVLDLPGELFMIGFSGLGILYFLAQLQQVSLSILKHPLSVLLILQLFWIVASSIFSVDFVISVKYFLAKCWFLIPCFAGTIYYLRDSKNLRAFLIVSAITTSLVYLSCLFRHGMTGFAFDQVNYVLKPFFRNHVDYACLAVVLLPYFYFLRDLFRTKWVWVAIVIALLVVQFSYTRAAYVALFASFGAYWVLQFKLVKPVLLIGFLATIVGGIYVVQQNTYLDYAPEFEKTISHHKFENLVSATAKGQDISTMERLYRWVAGGFMVKENWQTGVGAGNFFTAYKSYTVSSFKTYVSDNPKKSGIHCYYLMILVEQGIVGLLLFVASFAYFLIRCQYLYHHITKEADRSIIKAIFVSMVVILLILIINDMIENIKVGPYFYLAMGLLVIVDLRYQAFLSRSKSD